MLIPLSYVDDRQPLLDEMADLFSAQRPGWKWGVKRHLYAIEYAWALDQLQQRCTMDHAYSTDMLAGKRILDAGGGRGAMMGLMAVRGAQVTTIARAADRMAGTTERGVVIPEIECLVGDMAETGIAEGSLDAITCISALEHNPKAHIKRIVRHLVSLLKPGAPLVVTVPCGREEAWHPRGTWAEMPTASDTLLFEQYTVCRIMQDMWRDHEVRTDVTFTRNDIHDGTEWRALWDEYKAEMDNYPRGHRRPYLPGGCVLVRDA